MQVILNNRKWWSDLNIFIAKFSLLSSYLLFIQQAYQHLGETMIPKFTVIVAQKNHHTKIFQANAPENVPPGPLSIISSL